RDGTARAADVAAGASGEKAGAPGLPVASRIRELALEPGARIRVEEALPVPSGARGIVRFAAILRSDGEEIDSAESAFVALAPPRPTAPLFFRGNYFSFGDRTIFLFGSDAYANVYTSSAQGPIVWDRELAAARDYGFEVYENLGYSKPGRTFAVEDWRRFRGMALLAGEHGLVFMPGLLIGENVAVSDSEIAAESRQCREFAARLRDIPKLLWYVNGDYALRHDDLPALRAKWAAFLEARYGAIERLEEAWSRGPSFGKGFADVPFPPPLDGRWESVAAADLARFHLDLVRSWNAAHVAAIRSEETDRPITSEYYQEPFSGVDLRLTIDGLDVSNIGYFDEPGRDIELLPLRLRWNDLRSVGKSLGLGEYGVKTHPAWTVANGARGYHIARSEDEARRLFLAVAHIAFGMGASRVQNWCLRDSDERVFPWGVFYPGPLVPKDVAHVHRNLSLLFRLFEPRYEPPALTVLLPDGLRVGNHERLGVRSAYRAFEALLALGADFNVLGDSEAARIPEATRAVIYPAAVLAGDAAWGAILRWVEAGGRLLLSGGPIHDEDRRLRSAGRVERALGLRFAGRRYSPEERRGRIGAPAEPVPGSAFPPARLDPIARWEPDGGELLAAASRAGGLGADPRPGVLAARRALGRGRVSFVADPLELAGDEGALEDLRRIYGWFLEAEGLAPRPAAAAGPDLHVFAQATREGRVHVLFSRRKLDGARPGEAAREVTLRTEAGEIALGVPDGCPALAAVLGSGAVTAIEACGRARIAGEPVLEADFLAAVAALDGLDVRRSGALLVLPFGSGRAAMFSGRAWRSPRALFGDFERGRFRALEVLALEAPHSEGAPESARLALEVDADRATLVALVTEEAEAARWTDFLGAGK
ncbi:MAG: beta-galactosidase, partial [Planctomycetota bacterium]